METGNNFNLLIDLKDEVLNLEPGSVKNYHLSIQLGLNGFSFSILDLNRSKQIALFAASFKKALKADKALAMVEKQLRDERLLAKPFNSVCVAIFNKKSALVPVPLFDKNQSREFLKFNAEFNDSDVLNSERFKSLDAINVYAIEPEFDFWIKTHFPSACSIHYSTSLIENIVSTYKNTLKEPALFINFGESAFELILLDNKDLRFYNSFDFQTAEDFVYYVLFVSEQLKLNPENLQVKLSGEIGKTSEFYTLLTKYIRNIEFADRNENIGYSYKFDEVPGHYYYSLLNQFNIKP